jgi:hypothetical protein
VTKKIRCILSLVNYEFELGLYMSIRDFLDIGKIVALTLIAWLFHPRFWRKAAIATSRIGQTDRTKPVCNYILGHKYSESEIAKLSRKRRSYQRELQLQILGLNRPWRSWRPNIRLDGAPHLKRALEGRCGVILWVTETAFSTLVVKMALHNAGYQVCQLSRPGHGFSPSSFGIRFLNPIWTRIENRFIAERILIVGESSADAMATVRARLAANGIVMITVVPLAHKFTEAPFFQDQLQLPTGPIQLAMATGAALLPVFSFAKHNSNFEISIQSPLFPASGPIDTKSIASAYAERLEPFVLNHPDQWTGWHWLAGQIGHAILSDDRSRAGK